MKIFFFAALCLALTGCTNSKTFSYLPGSQDSVLVRAYIDVPAQIPVGLKLPASQLDSYHVGQRLTGLPYSTDPERYGNIYVEDEKGNYPIIIKSLTPQYGY